MAAMAGFFVCQASVVSAHAYISSLRRDYYCKVQRAVAGVVARMNPAHRTCRPCPPPAAKKLDLFRPEIAAALREISYFTACELAARIR